MRRPLTVLATAWVLLAGACAPEGAPVSTWGPPEPLRDRWGRELVLHGVNNLSAAKHAPGGIPPLTEATVERDVRRYGWNVVRYLIFWAYVEPAPGVIDTAYLDTVAERVAWYRERGAYVVLDMHQDVYGYAVGGNGAPAWATETDGVAPREITVGPWWFQNVDAAVVNAYRNFWAYDRHPELQEHFAAAWAAVARRFRDDPAVVGYELLNEPHPGDLGDTATPRFEEELLAPFYRRVIAAIRAEDPDTWILFEPQAATVSMGRASWLPRLFDVREGPARLVYAVHLYPLGFHEGVGYDAASRRQVALWFAQREVERRGQGGIPLFVTEFGGSDAQPGADDYFREVLARCDALGYHWALWSGDPGTWGPVDGDGRERPKLRFLVRTFPWAVAGRIRRYAFDVDTGRFELLWRGTPELAAVPTEVFVPARHYPDGFTVETDDAPGRWRARWDPERRLLSWWHDPDHTEHRLVIRPVSAPVEAWR